MRGRRDVTAARLEDLLRGLVSRKPIRAAVMAVERGDASFRWTGAMGEASPDGTPMRRDTPFFLASIDKLFNAAIAMMLAERGRLDLDARISAYLPRALTHGLHRLGGSDYSERIAIRHLLGHTSGLPDWLEDRPRGGRSLVDRIIRTGDLSLDIQDVVTLVRDRLQPHFPPQDLAARRQRIRYSDTNYVLLIAVMEAATGEPLHRLHAQLLFEPLGLRHTWFAGLSRPLDATPDPTVLRVEGRPLHIPLLLRSIRGMYSTTGDALAFMRGLVSGRVFRNASTFASMRQRWNRFGFPLDRAALRAPGWPIQYGLGIMRFALPRVLTPARPLPAVIGHTGSTGCWLFFCPQSDLFMAGSVDEITAGATPFRLVPKMLRVLARLPVRAQGVEPGD